MTNILIWGTGKIEKEFEKHIKRCNVLGYIVTEKAEEYFNGLPVYTIIDMPQKYDYIIMAVSALYHASVVKQCKKKGIDEKTVCFLKNSKYVSNAERNLQIAKEVFDEEGYNAIYVEFGVAKDDWVSEDLKKWNKLNTRSSMKIDERLIVPIYMDKYASAGSINSYFWQDLWAARKIYKSNPKIHYDIGSRIDGFISHLLTFRENVTLIDIRPLDKTADGLNFIQSDATNLNSIPDNSIESLSALCSLEHFGMGRYGDEIDPEACYKAFRAIAGKMKKGGDIYIAVPVGKEHVEFNAHRIFYATTIVNEFKDCELIEYSCTYDGCIEYNVPLDKYDNDGLIGGNRFGLFHFRKKY